MAAPDTALQPEAPDQAYAEQAVTEPAGGAYDAPAAQEPDLPAAAQGFLELAPAPLLQETRRSWKTSEFWTSIATVISVIVTSIPATDKLLITILGGAYAVARGVAKNGVPNVIPPEAPQD